jgi:hypothetical protein
MVTDIVPVCATEREAHASENLFFGLLTLTLTLTLALTLTLTLTLTLALALAPT